ncbi:MAG: HEAT repeat domain-containing protein [Anaerolineaceae bacterium]|nr:HEAT repeat domain-containing protein [Anaerolineaceae bacterium]
MANLTHSSNDPKDNLRTAFDRLIIGNYPVSNSAVDNLIRLLSDSSWGLRSGAALALGKTGNKKAVAPLIETLADEDVEVRRAVIVALGQLGDPQAIDPLTRFIADPTWSIRTRAQEAIDQIMSKNKSDK